MNKINVAERLRFVRSLTELNRRQFCIDNNISYATMSSWENPSYRDGQGLSEAGAKLIIRSLQTYNIACELNWLLYGQGTPPNLGSNNSHIENKSYIDIVKTVLKMPYWQVPDHNMEPCFEKGRYVFYQEINRKLIKNKQAYLIMDSQENLKLGYIIVEPGQLFLYNNNPKSIMRINPKKIFIVKAICK